MANVITSFFHSLAWFIDKFIRYTLVIVLIIYLLPKLFGLIEFAKYLGDKYLPVYREGYTLIDYDNHVFNSKINNQTSNNLDDKLRCSKCYKLYRSEIILEARRKNKK